MALPLTLTLTLLRFVNGVLCPMNSKAGSSASWQREYPSIQGRKRGDGSQDSDLPIVKIR